MRRFLLREGVTILNILTISPFGIGIGGKMFKIIFWLKKVPENVILIFF